MRALLEGFWENAGRTLGEFLGKFKLFPAVPRKIPAVPRKFPAVPRKFPAFFFSRKSKISQNFLKY
jgi:hypothetical protein